MENIKRNNLLLIGFILGIITFIFWIIWSTIPLYNGMSLFESINKNKSNDPIGLYLIKVQQIFMIICFIAGIGLNLLGWLKNNSKIAFVAAFVYIPTILYILTIASIILCFIGSAKIKKQNLLKN